MAKFNEAQATDTLNSLVKEAGEYHSPADTILLAQAAVNIVEVMATLERIRASKVANK